MSTEKSENNKLIEESKKLIEEKLNNLVVTPWTVEGDNLNYKNLIENFGCQKFDNKIFKRFDEFCKKRGMPLHQFIKREIVIAHRDLDKLLDHYEQNKPIYLYTGRGPSSNSMHIGHATPFMFTKYLQDLFDCPLVIQLTDDEKLLCKNISMEEVEEYTKNNIKDIISFGFKKEKTFIFSNMHFSQIFTKSIFLSKYISLNEVSKIFGFNKETNIGMVNFPVREIMPCFSKTFNFIDFFKQKDIMCLVPAAIDQDPFFRLARDKSKIMKEHKPATIYMGFLPALNNSLKMSSSEKGTILLNDTPKNIKNKINKFAFSGGQDTLENHRLLGGDTQKDISFQYLKYFMDSDEQILKIKEDYEKGIILTGELKAICIKEINLFLEKWQSKRAKITKEVIEEFQSLNKNF